LRLRDACHAAGEKISDTEVQRRVVTLAKLTPERAWLGEVASVALVQACRDARRAYKNWFGSLAGRRKGPKIRHPKPRRKHGRQSIRLTRNGFARHGSGCRFLPVTRTWPVRYRTPITTVRHSVNEQLLLAYGSPLTIGSDRATFVSWHPSGSVVASGWAPWARLKGCARHGKPMPAAG